MRISICMPVLRRKRMLAQALYSILMQGYDNFEVVIKDGDPDSAAEQDEQIRQIFSLLGSRLLYSVGRDGGIFPAVNDCLRRATGDILYFMCSDDLLCPGSLHAVAKEFEHERFGGALWLYGKTISADSTGMIQGIDGEPVSYDRLLRGNCIGQPATFWNRAMLNLAGNFDTRLKHAADYDLWLRFWKRRDPIFLNRELGVFRHHAKQNTKIYAEDVDREAKRISDRHMRFGNVILHARNEYLGRHCYPDGAPQIQSHHADLRD